MWQTLSKHKIGVLVILMNSKLQHEQMMKLQTLNYKNTRLYYKLRE